MVAGVSTGPSDPGSIFVDGAAYTDLPAWHRAAARLRREDPVHRVEIDGWEPRWVLTRHQHVWEVERQPERFLNTMRSAPMPADFYRRQSEMGLEVRALVHMDGDEHRAFRGVANDWFKPANLRRVAEENVKLLAREYVDLMMEKGPACDFAREVGLHFPLRVIMTTFGVPVEDEPLMLELTQSVFGSEDQEFATGDQMTTLMLTIQRFWSYFGDLTEDRRLNARNDIATVLAQATVNGAPIGDLERFSYYLIVATAGHDTTSSALNYGIEMLARHPDQLRLLRQNPAAIDAAVDEVLRHATPARAFMRYAAEDCEIGGKAIRAGDAIHMSYLSANFDEEKFEDPQRFDVLRPNAADLLSFGTGVHFCLGAHLSRMELRAFLHELIPRLDELELDGEPVQMVSSFVGGLKNLPVRYRLRSGGTAG